MNSTYTIISGTNRVGSNTFKIAQQYQSILAAKGIDARLVSLVDLDVSTRNQQIRDLEKEVLIPTTKFIFISPEYNGSIPGVLKSLFDSSDIEKVWWGKKALLTGVSTGRAGNLRGMEHLTGILHYLKMMVHHNKLPISVVNVLLNLDGTIKDEPTLKAINQQLDEFIAF
ncbi:MAG TPA: NAD(P)H-dependent oxidoreductase [Flavihumibacter sp.]|jgi:chromate reductase